jgi:hypothetical protein
MKTRSLNRTTWLVIVGALLCALLLGIAPASAQATPINMGDNATGEVTAANPIVEYTLTVPAAQGARIQVLAITPDFAPFFTVIDTTNGIPLLDVGVEGETASVQGNLTLAAAITYSIQVQSANGVFGQFVLSVQRGEAAPSGTPLTPGTPISDTVSIAGPTKQYGFTADPTQILLLNVHSENPAAGPVVRLRDADSGETLAASSTRLIDVRFGIPSGVQNYVVEVGHSGSNTEQAFMVCLGTDSGTIPCAGSSTTVSTAPTVAPLPTPPNFGSTNLVSGFAPDPFTVDISASGVTINMENLGSECTGYTTSGQPDYSVNYTSGVSSLLRFYFLGSGDATLLVQLPDGTHLCGDDFRGGLDPLIDINSPSSGRYDVWVGNYSREGDIDGTLYVTESAINSP